MTTIYIVHYQVLYHLVLFVPWHLTPASSEWPFVQLTVELCEQSVRLLSLPLQATLSRWIGPAPAPKWALLYANAPEKGYMLSDIVKYMPMSFTNVNRLWLILHLCIYFFYDSVPTLSWETQLSTHYNSICISPEVITHGTPHIVHADLHSAFIFYITSC